MNPVSDEMRNQQKWPEFRAIRVLRSYADQACLAALKPLWASRKNPSAPGNWDQVQDTLRRRWIGKLGAMQAAGWAPAQGKGFGYLRCCPPFAVKTEDFATCCKRALICPFCYARQYVRNAYHRLERCGCMSEKASSLRFSLISLATRLNLAKITLDKALDAVIEHLRGYRGGILSELTTRAGIVFYRLAVSPSSLILTRQTLVVVRAGGRWPKKTSNEGEVVGPKVPCTRRNLSLLVRRAFRYPDALWKLPETELTQVLDKLAGVRWMSTYGEARGQSEKPKEADSR